MKTFIALITTTLILMAMTVSAIGQEIKATGTHPPSAEVMELINNYRVASTHWASAEKKNKLKNELVSSNYQYKSQDGSPIGIDAFIQRQTNSKLIILETRMVDAVLHQYEDTALYTFRSWSKGTDDSVPFEGYTTTEIEVAKENGVWKVVSETVSPASGSISMH